MHAEQLHPLQPTINLLQNENNKPAILNKSLLPADTIGAVNGYLLNTPATVLNILFSFGTGLVQMRKVKFKTPTYTPAHNHPLALLEMDFSSQSRLKLRVAIIPGNNNNIILENIHRIVGVKREAGSVLIPSSPAVLKQFLLLIPFDSTFADLKSLTRSQYEKLYKQQTGYLPVKNILLFQDSNQCDLDEDYLVADICASNDLVYAVVEVTDQASKKIKITNSPNISGNSINNQQNQNQQQKPKQQQHQAPNSPKAQNEKKVPEFKPMPIKPPTSQKNLNANSKPLESKAAETKVVEIKPQNEVKALESKMPEPKKFEPKKSEIKVVDHYINTFHDAGISEIKESEAVLDSMTMTSETIPEIQAAEVHPQPLTELSIKSAAQIEVNPVPSVVKEQPKKTQPKKIQKPEARREQQSQQLQIKSETVEVSVKVVETKLVNSTTSEQDIAESASVPEICEVNSEPVKSERAQSIITPVPTPAPISRSTSSTPIFHPRKSSAHDMISSSSDDSDDESGSVLSNFDANNLFGSQVIASEPRRSDAFVLFAAGSSSEEDEDSSDTEMNNRNNISVPIVRTISPPSKSSSIVSLQAGPSSEISSGNSSSEDEGEAILSNSSKNDLLPQSVTLRRLSSVSPIPDPSEIPSLDELKESLCRAPTPIQILAEQQNHKNSQQAKKKKFHNHPTHNINIISDINNNKRGRPAKKQTAGRPKKGDS